jgi:hypothetical protein
MLESRLQSDLVLLVESVSLANQLQRQPLLLPFLLTRKLTKSR